MIGSRGRSVATSEGADHRSASSAGVDTVEFCLKKFIRGIVVKDFPRQVVNDVAEHQYGVCTVIINAFALWDEPP